MAAIRRCPMDTNEAKELGEHFSGAVQKWDQEKQELEAVHQSRHGFMGEQSNSSMQHSPAMIRMLQEGAGLLQAHSTSRQNQVEDGDERTVFTYNFSFPRRSIFRKTFCRWRVPWFESRRITKDGQNFAGLLAR